MFRIYFVSPISSSSENDENLMRTAGTNGVNGVAFDNKSWTPLDSTISFPRFVSCEARRNYRFFPSISKNNVYKYH